MKEKADKIAKLVWKMEQLDAEETIAGDTRDEFRDKVQKILDA